MYGFYKDVAGLMMRHWRWCEGQVTGSMAFTGENVFHFVLTHQIDLGLQGACDVLLQPAHFKTLQYDLLLVP